MKYSVSRKSKTLKGEVVLTSSKSLANRLLLVKALCETDFEIQNLAKAKDTQTLQRILENTSESVWDVGPAGTTMRFLCAYASSQEGLSVELCGTKRMHERPIGILVDALRSLGAEISYLEKEGYPPLKINGKQLNGGKVVVDGSVSSQFISALLLIAPSLKDGIQLQFEGKVASKPYIEMTLKTMEAYGASYTWERDTIAVDSGSYIEKPSYVEADWSAASYWFEIAALCEEVDFKIVGLTENSLQSDSACVAIYNSFGIESVFEEGGVRLIKNSSSLKTFNYDFTACPDIAQTVACTMFALGVTGKLTGLESLRIKETDRIAALKEELEKLGASIKVEGDDLFILESKELKSALIDTYEDHRMAMAYAPLAIIQTLEIDDPEVVVKSYPEYWKDLKQNGFEIQS